MKIKLEKELDKLLDILFDENLLHWKKTPSTDLLGFEGLNPRIKLNPQQIQFLLNILKDDGYINVEMENHLNYYSLTSKGILIKRNGGFRWKRNRETLINSIVIWAAVFTIGISFMNICEFINKRNKLKEVSVQKHQKYNSDSTKKSPKQILNKFNIPPIVPISNSIKNSHK